MSVPKRENEETLHYTIVLVDNGLLFPLDDIGTLTRRHKKRQPIIIHLHQQLISENRSGIKMHLFTIQNITKTKTRMLEVFKQTVGEENSNKKYLLPNHSNLLHTLLIWWSDCVWSVSVFSLSPQQPIVLLEVQSEPTTNHPQTTGIHTYIIVHNKIFNLSLTSLHQEDRRPRLPFCSCSFSGKWTFYYFENLFASARFVSISSSRQSIN